MWTVFFRHFPRRTVRLRLTLLYGVVFLVSGAALLGVTYILLAQEWGWPFPGKPNVPPAIAVPPNVRVQISPDIGTAIENLRQRVADAEAQVASQRAADLRQFLFQSAIALAIMSVISILLGWWLAGRVLRPLRAMNATAQRISEDNLRERLAIRGPQDELKDLADTLDGLFAQLETAFEAQRRFVANASHELRTPLTRSRTLMEVALDNPDVTAEELRVTCRRVLAAGEQQERLIEALLLLARSQRGLDRRESFDLAGIVGEAIDAHTADRVVTLDAVLLPSPTAGDPRLAKRLATNLIDNAVRHNVDHGWVSVRTDVHLGLSTLVVANGGPVISARQVGTLLQPFRRLDADRVGSPAGHGLGLSIVDAIATAHAARLDARPGAEGGLEIRVSFPWVSPPAS
jgi:signal transduction histidine kinase